MLGTQEIIMLILFVIGLVMLFSAFVRKNTGPFKGVNPVLAGVLGVVLVIPGFYYGVMPLLPVEEETPAPQTIVVDTTDSSDETHYATFDIEISESNASAGWANGTSSDASNKYTQSYTANTTQDDIFFGYVNAGGATGVSYYDLRLDFSITPVPWAGADNTDICTLYYEVLDPDQQIDTSSSGDEWYLWDKTDGYRQACWRTTNGALGATDYVDGSISMIVTDNETMQLLLCLQEDSLAQLDDALDSAVITIRFSNGAGWYEDFTVEYIMLNTGTATTPDTW